MLHVSYYVDKNPEVLDNLIAAGVFEDDLDKIYTEDRADYLDSVIQEDGNFVDEEQCFGQWYDDTDNACKNCATRQKCLGLSEVLSKILPTINGELAYIPLKDVAMSMANTLISNVELDMAEKAETEKAKAKRPAAPALRRPAAPAPKRPGTKPTKPVKTVIDTIEESVEQEKPVKTVIDTIEESVEQEKPVKRSKPLTRDKATQDVLHDDAVYTCFVAFVDALKAVVNIPEVSACKKAGKVCKQVEVEDETDVDEVYETEPDVNENVASSLNDLVALDFPTKEAMLKYYKTLPDANRQSICEEIGADYKGRPGRRLVSVLGF